jgi:hypothetical protein
MVRGKGRASQGKECMRRESHTLRGPTGTINRGWTPTPATHLLKGEKGRWRTRIMSYKKGMLAIKNITKKNIKTHQKGPLTNHK